MFLFVDMSMFFCEFVCGFPGGFFCVFFGDVLCQYLGGFLCEFSCGFLFEFMCGFLREVSKYRCEFSVNFMCISV